MQLAVHKHVWTSCLKNKQGMRSPPAERYFIPLKPFEHAGIEMSEPHTGSKIPWIFHLRCIDIRLIATTLAII
jgi:hypothetical protein